MGGIWRYFGRRCATAADLLAAWLGSMPGLKQAPKILKDTNTAGLREEPMAFELAPLSPFLFSLSDVRLCVY